MDSIHARGSSIRENLISNITIPMRADTLNKRVALITALTLSLAFSEVRGRAPTSPC